MKRGAGTRLLAAAALSVAAHAALLGGAWLTPPEALPELPPLHARLQRLEPLPPAAASPPRRETEARPRQAAAPKRLSGPSVAETNPFVPAPPAPGTDSATAAAEPAPEPVVVASAAPTVFRSPEAPPLPSFPRKGQITYTLTLGAERTTVGRTVQTWEFEDSHYKLGSQSESTGLVEVFRPHRYYYLSQGTLSDQGLRPDRFLASVRRGSRNEESLAVFNWEEGRIRLGRLPQQSTVALPAGSQDLISFMYQLALLPPAPGRTSMPFTRGRQLEITSFDVLPEENIDTPLGRLRTLPVVQVREGGRESLAVWLAKEYRNLPVRIRFYGRDGELSGEQLVNAIQVSEQ